MPPCPYGTLFHAYVSQWPHDPYAPCSGHVQSRGRGAVRLVFIQLRYRGIRPLFVALLRNVEPPALCNRRDQRDGERGERSAQEEMGAAEALGRIEEDEPDEHRDG